MDIQANIQDLQGRGPLQGYYPEPTKIILVIDRRNVAIAEAFFRGMGLKVVPRSLYLGGFIRDQREEATWLMAKVEEWIASVRTLLVVSCWHP